MCSGGNITPRAGHDLILGRSPVNRAQGNSSLCCGSLCACYGRRAAPEPRSRLRTVVAWSLGPTTVALIIGLGVAGLGVLRYGSLTAAIAYLQGYPVAVDTYSKSLGEIRVGEPACSAFALSNLIGKPVTIVGVKTSCGCMTASDLPLTIGAGADGDFTLIVEPRERDIGSECRHTALLYLDVPSPPIVLEVTGNVVASRNDRGS